MFVRSAVPDVRRDRRWLWVAALIGAVALLVGLVGAAAWWLGRSAAPAAVPSLARLDLAAGLPEGSGAGTIHLELEPGRPGANRVVVRLEDGAGAVLPGPAPAVEIAFAALDHEASGATVRPQPDAAGGYGAEFDLPGEGWWRAEVTLAPAGGAAVRVPFFLVLPDPNLSGEGPALGGDAAAAEAFGRGLAGMTTLRRVRFGQRLGDGGGEVAETVFAVSAGGDGRPDAFEARGGGYEQVIVGDREWRRRVGQAWFETPAGFVNVPAAWGATYADATGFRFGGVEPIDGEACRIVTFRVPGRAEPRRNPECYAWWIGEESGRVRREAMVSARHYMLNAYGDFDAPFAIVPPVGAIPVASPAATPVAGET